jgi:signal transduction histidine kinase
MRAADRSIDVSCNSGDDLFANIDGAQIEGALLNLSLNALDATPAGGHVQLRMRSDESTVYLDVENSGAMIPDSNLLRVFEPFFTTKPGGTGLGLAIARGIAVAHGGDLCVSCNRYGAVVFTLAVPKSSVKPFDGVGLHGKDSDN